jgi:hypothetical protein
MDGLMLNAQGVTVIDFAGTFGTSISIAMIQ